MGVYTKPEAYAPPTPGQVLMEDLKTIKELGIKGCRECCFSTGGQYFAAVNGTTISIYNTYSCENVGNLRGHNGKVRACVCVWGGGR